MSGLRHALDDERADGRQPGRSRLLAAIAATALFAGVIIVSVAGPAEVVHAGLSTPIPLNGAEEPVDSFTDDDALFVAVLSDIKGGKVCVVSAAVTSPGGGSCKHPAWGTPNNIVGLGTVIQPIEGPPLRLGDWKLLSEDDKGNGVGLSEVFSVDVCADCSREIAAAALGPWKLRAEENVIGSTATCTVMTILDKFDSARNLEWKTGGVTMVSVGLTLGGGFSFAIADPFEASQAKAKEILRELVCKVAKMYEDIANDPPRSDYQTVQPAVIGEVDPLATPDEQALANAMALQVGHGRASLADYERYLGAVLDGSATAAIAQSQAAANETFDLVSATTDVADALDTYAALLDADSTFGGPLFTTQADLDNAKTAYTRVKTTGFTAAELQQLQGLGLAADEIDTLRLNLGVDMSAVTLSTTAGASLRSLATTFRNSLETYDLFGREAAAVSGRRALDVSVVGPTASFTATPLTGMEPLQVAFDATASSTPNGLLTATTWDFGDNSTTSGPTATHSFAAGTYTVTLTVTDESGATDSTTTQITATPSTVPPTIFPPPDHRVSVGAAYLYTASATSMTASQMMTFDFDFGDGTQAQSVTMEAGATVNHTYAAPGLYDLAITVTNVAGISNVAHVAITAGSPVADAGPDVSGNEGSVIQLGGTSTSPDDANTLSKWDFGDDGGGEFGALVQHIYKDEGVYTATLTVTDGVSGESVTDTVRVTVNNVAPTATGMAYTATPEPGESSSFRAFAADVGVDDVFSAAWNFGDGATATGMTANHAYAAPGTYSVTATINDGDGGQVATSRTVLVGPRVGVSDSRGREHWVLFQTNYNFLPLLTLNIASEQAATGEVEVPGVGFRETFTVVPGHVTSVTIPSAVAQAIGQLGDIETNLVHVVADREVTVYGLNRFEFTTDAFLGLPRDVLGTDHVIAAYASIGFRSELSVGAPYNNTTVTVHAVGDVVGGGVSPYVYHLNAGDTIEIQGTDLTGSRVTSDKPVAVFGGHQCANIPLGIAFCDHITEQMPSTEMLGTRFVTVPLATRLSGDTFRVVASEADTTVTVNGQDRATIDAGEFFEMILDSPSVVLTSHPAVLAQYANGTSFDNVVADPFMMLVPPAEQYLPSYTVSTPAEAINTNFINLVAPTSALDSVRVDGLAVAPAVWLPVPGSSFSAAQLAVELGSHTVSADQPLGVFVYGFDNFDSYGYPGGFQLARIGAVVSITVDPATQTLPTSSQACVTATLKDALGLPVADVRVDHSISGANPGNGFGFSANNGTVSVCWTGAAAGTDTVTASVGNIAGSATVTWTGGGQPVNRPPLADAKSVTTAEDTPAGVTLSGSDPDGDSLTFAIVTSPAHGSLSGTGATRTYTPDASYFGPDSFTYRANDGSLDSNPATVSITVTAVNDTPVASGGSIATAEDAPVGATLTATDADADPLTFSIVTGPAHGTLTGTGANRTYTPSGNYFGPDSFTFKVNDGTADSNVATVTIAVTAVNDPPVADPTSATTVEDTAVGVTLSGSDIEASALTFTIATNPAHGALSGSGASRTYTPDPDYFGPDSFTYRANDGTVDSNVATVSITVTPLNDLPAAASKTATTPEDAAVGVTLSGGDIDGDALTFAVVTSPTHGSLSGTGASRTYTPAPNYFGPDSFTYTANDGSGSSPAATVSITVTPVNDLPSADAKSASTPQDTAVNVTLSGSDIDGDSLTFAVGTGPTHGNLSGSGAALTYTPNAGYAGEDSFTYVANDGAISSTPATVSIAVTSVNHAPTANDQSATTSEDTQIALTLTGADQDGNTITFAVVSGPAHGALGGTGASRTYTPAANYFGPDSFTFRTSDGASPSALATVSITVTPVNDAPIVSIQVGTPRAEGSAVPLTASASDVDGDTVTFTWSVVTTVLDPAGTCLLSATATASTSVTCTDDGSVVIGLSGNDRTTPVSTSTTVIVSNVAPVVKVRPISPPGNAPASVTVTADVTDAGSNDTATCTIAFGNGTTVSAAVVAGACTATTMVSAAGSFAATVTANDDDGGQGSGTAGYTVTSPAPPPTPMCTTVLGEGSWSSTAGTWKLDLDNFWSSFDRIADTIEIDRPGSLRREYLVASVKVVGHTATITSKTAKDGTKAQVVVVDNGFKGDKFSVEIVDATNRVKATTGGLRTVTHGGFVVTQQPLTNWCGCFFGARF